MFSFPAGTKMFQFPALASRILRDGSPSGCRVVPFGYPGINGRLRLPRAFRSLPRPSSPPRAKASAVRPSLAFRISFLSFLYLLNAALAGGLYCLLHSACIFAVAVTSCHRTRLYRDVLRLRGGKKRLRGNAVNPNAEPCQDMTSAPERRCSSRTFRYGYLVTT